MRLNMEEVQKQHKSTKKLYEQGLTVAPVDVKQVLDLYDTIEALQQENEQLRAKLGDWKYEVQCHMDEVTARDKENEQLRAQVEMMRETLEKAREALQTIKEVVSSDKNRMYWTANVASKALAAIDKAIGGKEDE